MRPCRPSGIAAAAAWTVAGSIFVCIFRLLSAEGSVDQRETAAARGEAYICYAEQLSKLPGRYAHWSGSSSAAGRRLRKRGGHSRMERDTALHFLHHLMNVPVKHRDRAKPLEDRKGLCAVRGAPAPLRVNRP